MTTPVSLGPPKPPSSRRDVAQVRSLSPRRRAQRLRRIQYGVLIAILALLAFLTDWDAVGQSYFRADLIEKTLLGGLLNAIKNTALYTVGAFIFGLILGTVLAVMKLSTVKPYRWFASAYIELFRGLPALLVIVMCSLVPVAFKGFKFPLGDVGAVWFALGLVAAAYMAETIRAGIQGVPKGQIEAARSLGMSSGLTMRKVVLPQAFRLTLPPLTNELILLIKDSSLIFVLGMVPEAFEIAKFGMDLSNSEMNSTPLIVAGFSYLVLTLPLSYLVQRMEKKSGRG